MAIAHILLTCQDKKEHELVNMIKDMDTVSEVIRTFGAYHIIIKLEADSNEKINHMINKIRDLPYIGYAIMLFTINHPEITNKVTLHHK